MRAVRSIAAVLLLSLAAACTGGETPGGGGPAPAGGGDLAPQAILRQASEDLAEQPVEARFTMRFSFEGETMEMSGDLAVDPATERAHVTMLMEGVPEVDGGEVEIVVDGSTMYMRSPFLRDAGWLKIDAAGAGLDQAFDGSGQMDPSAFLDFLRGADGIEVVGTEDVRGHETTHFSGTIDVADLIEHAPAGDEREQAQEVIDGLEEQLGPMEMTFDAWVDADGVPWRVSISMEAPADLDGSIEMTFDVIEIGGDVEIRVPSGPDVTDLGDIEVPAA